MNSLNPLIIKKTAIFSALLGAFVGIISLIPSLIGFCLFFLTFIAAPVVIIYMKQNEKHLGIINNEQGTILGAIIGFCSTIGFFIVFCPMVCIIKLIIKSYYTYMIPDMFKEALWLLILIVVIVALVFAATNSATAMGVSALYNQFEQKPQDSDAQIDIEIND